MSPLSPAYANAIVLFGQEACDRFGRLIHYWDAIQEPAAWDRFVFLLAAGSIRPPEQVPERLRETLRQSSYTLDAGCAVCPEEVVRALREKMAGAKVFLQCVVSGLGKGQEDPRAPVLLMRDLAGRFEKGTSTVFYLLLRDGEGEAAGAQRAFLEALKAAQEAELSAYPYLVSERARDDSAVPESALWRAVFHEMLANSAGRRALAKGQLYSLGYSVLNADDSELENLRRQTLREEAGAIGRREFSPADAWTLLTQGRAGPGPQGEAAPERDIREWVGLLVKEETSLPGEKEKHNNRILSRAHELDNEAMLRAVRRFYRINCGPLDWKRFGERYLAQAIEALCRTPNAPAFPAQLVRSAIAQLRRMETPKTEPLLLPQKGLLTPSAAHRRACCEAIEKGCEEEIRSARLAGCAGALREALEGLLKFLAQAKASRDSLKLPGLTGAQCRLPTEKYPNYWKSIRAVRDTKGDLLFSSEWTGGHAPYYASDGQAIEKQWLALLDDGEKILRRELPPGFSGSFCEAVGKECATDEALGFFFDRHLLPSTRMLYNIHDAQASLQTLYFADRAFENHPWISRRQDQCVIARNDNVERVDLYPLAHSASWYLDDPGSLYFAAPAAQRSPGGGAGRLFEQKTEGEQAVHPREEAGESAAEEQEDLSQDLDLRVAGGEYILSWNWKPGAQNATVRIVKDGCAPRSIPCSNAEYVVNHGVRVIGGLPYGKVSVSVFCDGALYARREMAGMKNRVRYRLEPGRDGSGELVLTGRAEDIGKLALAAARGENRPPVYYPLNPDPKQEKQRFKGLYLPSPSHAEVRPLPGDEFPEAEAVRG